MRGFDDGDNDLNLANLALQHRWILPSEPLHSHPKETTEDDEKEAGILGVHSRQYMHFDSSDIVRGQVGNKTGVCCGLAMKQR